MFVDWIFQLSKVNASGDDFKLHFVAWFRIFVAVVHFVVPF